MKDIATAFGRIALLCVCLSSLANAGEGPYFVTYTSWLEEQGNLEIENKSAVGHPGEGNLFWGESTAFEYGLKGWWTTEIYVDGQATAREGAVATGYRFENRFRLARRQHWVNPVLYAEFEDITEANKSLLEVVGHDGQEDLAAPNADTHSQHQHEAELKLLLGSDLDGWNVSENFIFEKNLGHAPWEFGYAFGVSRPLALAAQPGKCNWCRENFSAGVEFYGGLGNHKQFGLQDTSHYAAPVLAWTLENGTTFTVSPGFGMTSSSLPFLLRFGISYEIQQVWRTFRR